MGHRQVEQAALFYEFSPESISYHLLPSMDRFVDFEQVGRDLGSFDLRREQNRRIVRAAPRLGLTGRSTRCLHDSRAMMTALQNSPLMEWFGRLASVALNIMDDDVVDHNCGKDRLPTALAAQIESSTHWIGGRTEYENTNKKSDRWSAFSENNIINSVGLGR